MRKGLPVFLVLAFALAAPAQAQVTMFGTIKVKPTFYGNFDFDSGRPDAAALNEAGWISGEHVRTEARIGWKASGDKWSLMGIMEADIVMEKDTADRSFYGPATKQNWTNFGAEFGIERLEASYTFAPEVKLATGWNIRAMDIATGGMVFGDDHPFIELSGGFADNVVKYQLGYLMIQNRATAPSPVVREDWKFNDWRAYYLKLNFNVPAGCAKLNVSPFGLASDNNMRFARAYYYGAEVTGDICGIVKPFLEFAGVTGRFFVGKPGGVANSAWDISSIAGFAGLQVTAIHPAFQPYVAVRYVKGDDDLTDTKAEGFVGVTDIGRFTGLLGMDGNILSEHLASGASIYNSPLYSYSPDRAVGGALYGGIGNGSSGNNPGQVLLAVGASGDLSAFVPNVSYKVQGFLIRYDKTGNLVNTVAGSTVGASQGGAVVDKAAGITVDANVKYTFSPNFAVDLIASVFLPGDGIKQQIGTPTYNPGTPAQAHTLTLSWTY